MQPAVASHSRETRTVRINARVVKALPIKREVKVEKESHKHLHLDPVFSDGGGVDGGRKRSTPAAGLVTSIGHEANSAKMEMATKADAHVQLEAMEEAANRSITNEKLTQAGYYDFPVRCEHLRKLHSND